MKFQTAVGFPCNILIGHLNINSIRNKFELLLFLIGGKVDILLMSETKIHGTFPTSLFLMSCNSNFVKDNLITIPASGCCFSEKTDISRRIKPQQIKMVDLLLLQSS